jgi:lipoprotein NlpI
VGWWEDGGGLAWRLGSDQFGRMIRFRRWAAWLLVGGCLAGLAGAAEPPAAVAKPGVEEWMARAQDSQRRGLMKQALEMAGKAVESAPTDPRPLHYRAQLFERMRQLPSCEADLTKALTLVPDEPTMLLDRGILRLRLGDYAGSVADLDRYVELRPARMAELWQRGIALFYAGRYEAARRQFEVHRTVNPEDVENSAWHFCCVAKLEGWESARKALLPVAADGRIPMREIQALYAGRMKPGEVLKAVEGVEPESRRASGMFYAHLYLALYHGALGERQAELKHAAEASRLATGFGIMGEIAVLHARWVAAGDRKAGK